MQQIKTEIIPEQSQRYPTLGDYFEDSEGILHFKISNTGNNLYNKVILVHEILEQLLTQYEGIKEEDIFAFDLWVEEEIEAGRYDGEPGEHPLSPYKKQHIFAENIERQIMNFLGIDFKQYENDLIQFFEK